MIKNPLKQNIVFSVAIILSILHVIFAYFVIPKFSAFYAHYSHPLPLSIRFLEEWRLLLLPLILVTLVAHHLLVKPTPKKFGILITAAIILCILLFLFPALVFLPLWTLAGNP